MSVPTGESSLVLAAVDSGSKYMWKMDQPGHSLSWPQSAHSGSRDPPPGIGWPPGEVLGHCGSRDTDRGGLRIVFLLLFSFLFVLFSFLCCYYLFFNLSFTFFVFCVFPLVFILFFF